MLSSQSKKKSSSKMMRRRERGEVLEAPEIPFDLQIEIVNRLPIKSLARFKCVSKLWSSLICSKGYIFASPPRLFISLRRDKYVLLSLSYTSSKNSTAFDLDIIKEGIGEVRNMVVLHGLILYQIVCCKLACIYNPTTGQRITLPAIKFNMAKETGQEWFEYFFYFFGYDPVLDQYKVVCTVVWSLEYTEHWVFVLESGNFWKRIDFDRPHIPYRQSPQGLCINGVISYLAFSQGSGNIVISFDVRSEEFNMIQLPDEVSRNGLTRNMELIEYGGKPTFFDYRHLSNSLVNLWVLEDAEKWSNKSMVLQPCQRHFFPSCCEVIGTTQNGEVVLKPEYMCYPYYILYYDLHKNDVRKVDIRGISEDSKSPFRLALMDTGVSIKYI